VRGGEGQEGIGLHLHCGHLTAAVMEAGAPELGLRRANRGLNAEDGEGRGLRATNSGELAEAIKVALANQSGPTLIECVIDRDECTSHLISWGRLVTTANARPPRQRGGPCLPAPVVRSCGEYARRSGSRKVGRFI
jgi:hypothetical protein